MLSRFALLLLVLNYSASSWAQDSETSAQINSESRMEMEDVKPEGPLSTTINLQMGASAFDYSGADSSNKSKTGVASSLTAEFGSSLRFLETGVMYYESMNAFQSATVGQVELTNKYIGMPLMAKFYPMGGSRGLFLKGGMITSFLMDSNRESDVRKLDLVGSIATGGKIKIDERSDFLIEASYNRGFMDQLKASGDTINQGFMVLGGVTFRL